MYPNHSSKTIRPDLMEPTSILLSLQSMKRMEIICHICLNFSNGYSAFVHEPFASVLGSILLHTLLYE